MNYYIIQLQHNIAHQLYLNLKKIELGKKSEDANH